jgi:hypothetical protein
MMGKMKKLTRNEHGFIPMMIAIIAILVTVIVLVYLRVAHAKR